MKGRIYIAEGAFDVGIETLTLSAETAPSRYLSFRKDLVRGYLAAGLASQAIDASTQLISINDRDAESLCLLARAFEMAGRSTEAQRHRRRALDIWEMADPGFCPMETLSRDAHL